MPVKAPYVCTFAFEITADLKPWAQRQDVKWMVYHVGDPVSEKVVKASPGLLKPRPNRCACVKKVED